jgi:uncharacterized RDD family membrane protein YckC
LEQQPTRVVGRRVVARIVDLLLVLAIAFGLFLLLTHTYPKENFKNGLVLGHTRHAFAPGTSDQAWWIAGSAVAALIILVLLPGLRGWSPGKLVTGIRLVNAEGNPPGILRSLLREILWIVDGFPGYALPLVGFVTALATKANQRVGDLAARTFVVRSSATGHPIGRLVPEVAGFPAGSQPTAAPQAQPGDGQPSAAPSAQPVETSAAEQPAEGGGSEQPAGAGGAGQPAGWYGDPQGQARLRWWDGSNWTDNTSA